MILLDFSKSYNFTPTKIKSMGMLEAVGEVFPEAKYQRCVVHFYRNVFSAVPRSKVKLVAKMLKAIHTQESKKAAREKAKAVVVELQNLKLKEAAKKVEDGIEETLTYADFPSEHWTRIRTNNVIERLNREIRRRTRVVGCFPDGNSALMTHFSTPVKVVCCNRTCNIQRSSASSSKCASKGRKSCLNINRPPFLLKKAPYLVPKMRSPASPRPGTIYPWSFRRLSSAAA